MRRSGSTRLMVCPYVLCFCTPSGDDAPVPPELKEPTPYDLEEEELAAYAAEYELHLEDLNPDDFFTYSDIDDFAASGQDTVEGVATGSAEDDDVEMVM